MEGEKPGGRGGGGSRGNSVVFMRVFLLQSVGETSIIPQDGPFVPHDLLGNVSYQMALWEGLSISKWRLAVF